MKRIMICMAALLLIFCVAAAEEIPATYAEVQALYGLPNVIPSNAGLKVEQNSVCVWNLFHAFNKGVITYTDEGGEKVTVEGIYNSKFHQFDWPTSTLGVEDQDGNITLPADATVELTGEVPCGEGYRAELVYRRMLTENIRSAALGFADYMKCTGLRLYDQTGTKVLEVWLKTGEVDLRCIAVTFYPVEGKAYTVEYPPEAGDMDRNDYGRMSRELTAGNNALGHPAEAPDTLEEVLTLFPKADLSLNFRPIFNFDGTVRVEGIPSDVEVLYASLHLADMYWHTTSIWNLVQVERGVCGLKDPAVLPRVLDCYSRSGDPGLVLFYRDENGLIMHLQYTHAAGCFVTLPVTTEEGHITLAMLPHMVRLSCSDKDYTPLWHAYYDLETGERMP